MDGFRVHPHAARRWAERVAGIENPNPSEMRRAADEVACAMLTARRTVRYAGSKRRIFVTPDGVHLLIAPGAIVISVMHPDWTVKLCPCDGCVHKRAQALREGRIDPPVERRKPPTAGVRRPVPKRRKPRS